MEHLFYAGNDVGEVYQLDSSKDWLPTGKFKGINTSITDLVVRQGRLYTTSMDCYARIFDLEERTMLKKFYMNKSATALWVDLIEEVKLQPEGEEFVAEEVE